MDYAYSYDFMEVLKFLPKNVLMMTSGWYWQFYYKVKFASLDFILEEFMKFFVEDFGATLINTIK